MENIQLLRRIVGALEIPPEFMGLSWWGPDGRYWGPGNPDSSGNAAAKVARPPEGVEVDVLRRHALLLGGIAAFGAQIKGIGAPADPYPVPGELPLPSRLDMSHIAWIEQTTEDVWALRRAHGGQAELASAAASHFTRWRGVDAAEDVQRALLPALAGAHRVAGLCCFDSGHDWHARDHFRQALELAIETDDHHRAASVLLASGQLERVAGHSSSALKCYQLGHSALARTTSDDPQTAYLTSWLNEHSAWAYAQLNDRRQALTYLSRSRDGWEPPDTFQRADFDWSTANVVWRLGRLDDAEPFAASAARNFSPPKSRDGVKARITVATLHVHTGESDGLMLAHQVINDAAALHSVPTRQRLLPLAQTLDTRPSSDAKDLARSARQAAAIRT